MAFPVWSWQGHRKCCISEMTVFSFVLLIVLFCTQFCISNNLQKLIVITNIIIEPWAWYYMLSFIKCNCSYTLTSHWDSPTLLWLHSCVSTPIIYSTSQKSVSVQSHCLQVDNLTPGCLRQQRKCHQVKFDAFGQQLQIPMEACVRVDGYAFSKFMIHALILS